MAGVLSYLVFFATLVSIFAIAVLGLNLQWGLTGLFNAGVVGFYAVGAYTMAILTAAPRPGGAGGLGLPFLAGLPAALSTTAVAAWIVGRVTMRLRGDYLAIATFGVAVVVQLVALNFERLTGGNLGLAAIPRPLAGWLGASSPLAANAGFLALVALIAAGTYRVLERMVRSPWGRVLRAVREDEIAAAALGKAVARFRLEAFVLGSALAGLAGALYAAFIGFVSPWDFLPIVTFQFWTMLIVGGSGNNRGAVLGAVVVWGLWSGSGALVARLLPTERQTQGGAVQVVLIGLVLCLTLLFRPRGLIGEAPVVSERPRA